MPNAHTNSQTLVSARLRARRSQNSSRVPSGPSTFAGREPSIVGQCSNFVLTRKRNQGFSMVESKRITAGKVERLEDL
jgi:hypothetical protein